MENPEEEARDGIRGRVPFGPATRLRGLLVLLVLAQTAAILLIVHHWGADGSLGFDLAVFLGMQLPVLWWVRRRLAASGSSLRAYVGLPQRARIGTWAWIVICMMGLGVADYTLVGHLFRAIDPELFRAWFVLPPSPETPYGPLLRPVAAASTALSGILLAPLTEELLFRGVLLDVLEPRWGRTAAWWSSAVLFGVLHFPRVVSTTLFALVLSAARRRTGSLAVPIGIHMANNVLPSLWPTMELATWGSISGTEESMPYGAGTVAVLLLLFLPMPLRVLRVGWRTPSSDG